MTASYLIDPMAVADEILTDADAATDARNQALALRRDDR